MTPREVLAAMFREMVIAKDASQISRFFHPDFQMTSNGITQLYRDFAAGHVAV